jgi:hypothetical protein
MANLGSTVKKTARKFGKDFINPLRGDPKENTALNPMVALKRTESDIDKAFTPEMPAMEDEPIIPIPDESLLANESRRRRARKSQTGRQSTILTGLGG